jgi:hypothetical protein
MSKGKAAGGARSEVLRLNEGTLIPHYCGFSNRVGLRVATSRDNPHQKPYSERDGRGLGMTVTIDLNPEIEHRLLAQARERGVSVDTYLQEIVSKQVRVASTPAVADGTAPELPRLHLGVTGPLQRSDIYDDVL